jgi:osmotically-inducible protein OsmY
MADDERRRGERDWERYRRSEEDRNRGGYEGDYRRGQQRGYGHEGYGRESFGGYGGHGPERSAGEYRRGGGYEGEYGGREGGYGRESFGGYGREGYGGGGYGREDYRGREERGFFERAGDEMASWFGAEDAERRRRQDARYGDQGAQHHRGRGPRGYTRSDERIRDDVNDRLTDDPYVDASEIEVTVSGGEVTLSGTVDSRHAKRRAEDIADDVSGVTHVQNNLRVRQGGTSGYGSTAGTGAAGTATGSATSATTGSTTS